MRKLSVPMFLTLILLVSSIFTSAIGARESIDQLIVTKEVARIEEAITLLKDLLEKNPEDGEVLWLLAKAHLYLGDRVEEEQLTIYEEGKEYADRSVEILPTVTDGYYWQSALIGRIGETRGILSSLFMVRPMKNALDSILELDENHAEAYWILSQLYQRAPGFPLSIGNKKLALENAVKATELDPMNIEFQLQLAKALEHNGKNAEAIIVLEELLEMPQLGNEPEVKGEAEELFAKLKK